MDIHFVEHGSHKWQDARELRYALFFEPHGLAPAVMDDGQELHAAHLVAAEGGRVVGYGRLSELGGGAFHVSQIVVLPTHQRQGIGKMILQRLVSRAESVGAASVELKARLSAVEFYSKAGFQQCGEVFLSTNTGLPHVNMVLKAKKPIAGCSRPPTAAAEPARWASGHEMGGVMNISGSCMCGTVSYSGSAEPVIQGNCHCTNCQKITGSAYSAMMFFPQDTIEIHGDIKHFKRIGESGNETATGFCPQCGTQLVSKPGVMQGMIGVRVGTLDHPEIYKPTADIFTRSAAPWDHMDPNIPKFEEYPPLG